jgi:N-acetylmuramoyl-L-alanine amidase
MEVNLAIAKRAEKILEKDGAKVLLSHQTDTEEVGLADRPKMAWDDRADVFISVHNNTLSPGENPFKSEHGFSIFYYLPQSLQLARAVEKQYKKLLPWPDEGTRYGNYLVLRMTEMPAILTESAYLSDPAQEADLLDSSFQNKIANAIVLGVKSFFNRLRVATAHPKLAPVMASALKPKPKTPIALRHQWKKRRVFRKRRKHHARKS